MALVERNAGEDVRRQIILLQTVQMTGAVGVAVVVVPLALHPELMNLMVKVKAFSQASYRIRISLCAKSIFDLLLLYTDVDPLPTTDLKRLETCLLEIRTNTNCTGELTQAQECSSIIGSMELTGDDEITASSSKSLLDMWLCPDFSFKEPATVASGQDNETSSERLIIVLYSVFLYVYHTLYT